MISVDSLAETLHKRTREKPAARRWCATLRRVAGLTIFPSQCPCTLHCQSSARQPDASVCGSRLEEPAAGPNRFGHPRVALPPLVNGLHIDPAASRNACDGRTRINLCEPFDNLFFRIHLSSCHIYHLFWSRILYSKGGKVKENWSSIKKRTGKVPLPIKQVVTLAAPRLPTRQAIGSINVRHVHVSRGIHPKPACRRQVEAGLQTFAGQFCECRPKGRQFLFAPMADNSVGRLKYLPRSLPKIPPRF